MKINKELRIGLPAEERITGKQLSLFLQLCRSKDIYSEDLGIIDLVSLHKLTRVEAGYLIEGMIKRLRDINNSSFEFDKDYNKDLLDTKAEINYAVGTDGYFEEEEEEVEVDNYFVNEEGEQFVSLVPKEKSEVEIAQCEHCGEEYPIEDLIECDYRGSSEYVCSECKFKVFDGGDLNG